MAETIRAGAYRPRLPRWQSPRPRSVESRWGAVLAGAVIVIAIQISLSLLGLGIGLSTSILPPETRREQRAWASAPASGGWSAI